jgi:hypothetical protein
MEGWGSEAKFDGIRWISCTWFVTAGQTRVVLLQDKGTA